MLADRLVAHRGYQKHYPENTLIAFREAIAAGARHIETDIQFSADGMPVLYHDMAMKRLSGIEDLVSNLPLAQLTQLNAHEPGRLGEQFAAEPIATLQQLVALLQAHPEVTAFVEMKDSAVQVAGIEAGYEQVAAALAPVAERAVLISFNYEFIAYARHRGHPQVGVVLRQWADLDSGPVAAINADFAFCDIDKLPAGTGAVAVGPTLVVYEVADAAQAIALFDRGVDMIETFDIGGLLHSLGRHAL